MRRAVTALVVLALTGACTLPGDEKPIPVKAAATARPGGAIRIAITAPGGVEPASAYEPAGMAVVATLCDTLVEVDPATGKLRPGLAESWVVSDRGGSVQVKLRKGRTFSDGTAVNSRAVVESFRRLASPDTASYAADLLSPLAGFAEYRASVERGEPSTGAFRGARVVEPLSFELLFSRAAPDFMRTLAHPATAPMNTRAATPVCAGPYELAKAYEPGAGEIVLRRKAKGSLEGGGPARTRGGSGWADQIVFEVFADEAAGYDAWTQGRVDVAAVPADRLAQADSGSVLTGPAAQVEYIGVGFGEQSVFREARVRRTLSAAIDRVAIANDVYGGSRRPATGFVPAAVPTAHRDNACRWGEVSADDAAAVRAAVGAAPVKLSFNDEFAHRRLVEAVASQWRARLGIAVDLVPLNWDAYLQKATTGAGFDGAFRVSWSPSVATDASFIAPLFHSRHIGSTNVERYRDPNLDESILKDVEEVDNDGDRIVHVAKLEDRLCQDMPLIPVVEAQANMAVRTDRVAPARRDGKVFSPTGGLLARELFVRAG
jgi:ABC-type transport system substrate-binding protein